MKFKYAAGIFAALLIHPAFAAKDGTSPFPAEWTHCKADTDCVVAKGLCGNWDCVNRVSVPALEKLNTQMEKEYGCLPHDKPIPPPDAACTPKGCRCKPRPGPAKKGW